MQNWEEYEADYYGEFPDDRMEWNMRGRRRGMMPYEPEDRIDTRMRDGYGDRMRMDRRMDEDMYPENRMGGSMYPENRMFRDDMEEGLGEMSDRGGRRINDWNDRRTTDWNGSDWNDRRMDSDPREMNETWRDMEEFEGLYDDLADEITEVIRQICDSVDGEGCAAIEGELTRELLEMMIDRIMEQLGVNSQMPGGQQQGGQMPGGQQGRQQQGGQQSGGQQGTQQNRWQSSETAAEEESSTELSELAAGRMDDRDALRRSLVKSLLFHELLRRRMNRRMRRRNRDEYRDRRRR